MLGRARNVRSFLLACSLGCGLVLSAGQAAWASTGCAALNGTFTGGAVTGTVTGTQTAAGFNAGDVITAVLTGTTGTGLFALQDTTAGTTLLIQSSNGTFPYTVPATTPDTFSVAEINEAGFTVTWTCVSASTSGGNTDSQKLASLQQSVTPMVATTSGQAITGAINNAIDNAFGNGGAPFSGGPGGFALNFVDDPKSADKSKVAQGADSAFGALAYVGGKPGKMPLKAPSVTFEREWSLWAEFRETGWQDNDVNSGYSGHQINVTAGLGRKLNSDLLLGVVAGYEHFNYNVSSLTGSLSGHGATVGAYGGWKIVPTLRLDAAVTWSRVNYDASAGTASGSFHGNRWLVSSGLTGDYAWRGLIFAPSARIFALWEEQNGYTDSLGTAQPSNSFSAGRVSSGGKVTYPWTIGTVALSPYVGVYGDWRFGSNTTSSGNAVIGISNGWSARVTGGLSMKTAFDATLTLGGEYGGIGADYKIWSGEAKVAWRF